MKKHTVAALLLLSMLFCLLGGCQKEEPKGGYTREECALAMDIDFAPTDTLAAGGGKPARVILLLGQSNASGCSITEYLQLNTDAETFAALEAGFPSVKINYCIDNGVASSEGEFLPVDLTAGCGAGFFGPEVGMAEVLSAAFPEEEIFLLKYTMSGYSLDHHWLFDGERAWIYDACLLFLQQYIEALRAADYRPRVEAVCWMQGESDTAADTAARYYDNQAKFLSYLREDLAPYTQDAFLFVDAGISNSPYCEPGYPTVNEAKRQLAKGAVDHVYFDTIEMGLTTLYEPDYAPDLGHYDSLSEIALGRRFGEELVRFLRRE